MEIKYSQQSESNITVGIGDYSNCGDCPHGISEHIWEAAKGAGAFFSSAEHAQLRNCENLTAYAKAHEIDEDDPEVGHDVVRDKLIIRDGERYDVKMRLLEKYLAAQLVEVSEKIERNASRVERAQKRLDDKLAAGRTAD